MKKAFDSAKAANQFASSSNYFFFAAFFFVAFFFIGMVCVPPMERSPLVWRSCKSRSAYCVGPLTTTRYWGRSCL